MNTGVDVDTGNAIERLAREAASPAGPEVTREAARRTGGVPVHADLGGVLVVAVDGSVLHYDPETDTVSAADERWRSLARAKAARLFPELRSLAPQRPFGSVACDQCGGSGEILGGMDCGACLGVGWKA